MTYSSGNPSATRRQSGKNSLRTHPRQQEKLHAVCWCYLGPGTRACVATQERPTPERFAKQYGVHRLGWYEPHPAMESGIGREKQLKRWHRSWKIGLIDEVK